MSFASGLQPVDWSLVQLGQSPPLPIIPLSDTVLAPARCLSRLVIKKFVPYPSSFCSSCPLASPHTSHLLQPVGSPPSLQTLTHMESQPLPSPGKGLSRGNREGATTQPNNLAGLCTPPKPLSVPIAISQESKFVRSVSHCVGEDVVSLSEAKTCCNPTLQQKKLSSSPTLKFILL